MLTIQKNKFTLGNTEKGDTINIPTENQHINDKSNPFTIEMDMPIENQHHSGTHHMKQKHKLKQPNSM